MDKTYRPLTIPKLVWDKKTLTQTYGELVAQPLEPGFGITLGNALRRILLGGIEGSAVTSFIVKGINNEFKAIPGMLEDALQLSLNLKGIIVKNHTGLAGTLKVVKKGSGVVTVADIQADEHLELVNKDHVLGTMTDDGECDITMFVESGRGYQIAQWPADKAYQEDGRIYIDAMFCPITKVMFDVEKTRVGEAIDFDRLILRIYTNGSLNPLDALHYAVSVLRTQLEHFLAIAEIPFNVISTPVKPSETVEAVANETENRAQVHHHDVKDIPVELLLKPIEELDLPPRAHNCLTINGIKRVIDLVNINEDALLDIKNFGLKSLTEVKERVKALGLSFGMNINEEEIENMLAKKDESHERY